MPVVSKDDATQETKTYVLVHGSFQGPYAWQFIQPALEAAGHKVVVVELPGHGTDHHARLQNFYRCLPGQGHCSHQWRAGESSAGRAQHGWHGHFGRRGANSRADRKLVYIAGFVPKNGQTLLELAQIDPQSLLGPALMPSADMLTLNLAPADVPPIFCQDGSSAIKQMLVDKNRPEPAIPYINPVSVSAARFGSVDKYLRSARRWIMPSVLISRNQMLTGAGITKTFSLSSGHCPFLSQPDAVTDILLHKIK